MDGNQKWHNGMLTADLRASATRSYISTRFHCNQASQTDTVSLLSRAYTFISLFVTRYLHTQPLHKMRSTALTSLGLALFALFSGG